MISVSDSSPIISLAAIDRLELLRSIFTSVVIPQAVYDEIVAGNDRPGSEIAHGNWIDVRKVESQRRVKQLMTSAHLHLGESETIVLAGELKAAYVILDDQAARKTAHRKAIPVIGTLGVLLVAKATNLISEVEPCLRQLIAAGKYVDPVTYRDILVRAGEI